MKHLDTLFAIFIILAGSLVSLSAYREIKKVEQPDNVFLEDFLKLGENRFDVLSGASCIGNIVLSVEKENSTIIKGNGVLRVTFKDVISDISVSFHTLFNPLDQLAGAEAKVRFNEMVASMEAENINPIHVNLSFSDPQKSFSYNLEAKGPITISEHRPGFFRVEYRNRLPVKYDIVNAPLEQIRKQIGLSVIPHSEDSCLAEAESRFDLSSTSALITTLWKSGIGSQVLSTPDK